ncbi:MAG: ATP-binding protein, partial [Desulfobacterales bacterium]
MSDDFSRLEWILKNSIQPGYEIQAPQQAYGDLTEINGCRLILDAVGRQTLADIAEDAIDLLDTSVAVYERTGDYAFGLFASGWCRLMDSASRGMCKTADNGQALSCGKWLCHESCWNDAGKTAIESGRPTDIECVGGIRLYAEPIFAGGRVVGAINIGYGNPPTDRETLKNLARKFNIPEDEIRQAAQSYVPRPDIIVEIAKKRLKTAARLIGQMVERQQREDELLESKRRMDTLLRNLPGMAYRCRNVGRWTMKFVSHGCLALTGYTAAELTEDRIAAYGYLVHPEDAGHVWRKVQESLRQKNHFEIEYRIVAKNGDIKWVWERGVATGLKDDDGVDLLEGFISDITERKAAEEKQRKLENQLAHGRRMEALGRLAGGIAHDFNNLLFVVLGYSEMVLQDLPENHPDYKSIQEILDASRRGRDLIGQLLAFGRRQHLEMKVVDVNHVISGLEAMLGRIIGEDIELQVNLDPGGGYVKADISQVEQILMNLAVNARDAMPEGGMLRIETGTSESENGSYPPDSWVFIRIADNGIGMDREALEKLFEPFYSTKEKDKGSGLGLATVHGIVKQHGGNIDVSSQPGKGTCFVIYLPRTEEAAVPEKQEAPIDARQVPAGTPANVLVVEDDETVRKLACKVLAAQGHKVIEAQSGFDAVEKAGHHAEPIDLLLTDVVMPEMKGPDVYSQIAKKHPEVKVLYMSGYSENILEPSHVDQKNAGFIQKPFSLQELRREVDELLG